LDVKKRKYKLKITSIESLKNEVELKAKKAELYIRDLEMEQQKAQVNDNFQRQKIREFLYNLDWRANSLQIKMNKPNNLSNAK